MTTWEQAHERAAVFPQADYLRLHLEAGEHLGSPPPTVEATAKGEPVLVFEDRRIVLRASGVWEIER